MHLTSPKVIHKLVRFTLFLTHGRILIDFSVYSKLVWAKSYIYSSLIFNGHILSLVHFFCTLQLCCPSEKNAGGNSLLLGLVKSREAKIGMQIRPAIADSEKYFDVILSLDFVKKLQSNKLQFDAIPRAHSFVEKVDKEWVTVTASTPNSFELSCSIYSYLNACSLDKVSIVEVRE